MAGLLIGTDSSSYSTITGAETLTNKTLTTPTVGNMSNYTFPDGHIIQSKTTHDKTLFTFSWTDIGNNYTSHGYGQAGTDYTGIDVTITPSSASHKLVIFGKISIGIGASNAGKKYGSLRMKRSIGGVFPTFNESNCPWHTETSGTPGSACIVGISTVGNMSESGSSQFCIEVPFGYEDSPNTTSAIVYRMNFLAETDGGSTTGYVNGNAYRSNDYGSISGTSYMTVMEVLA